MCSCVFMWARACWRGLSAKKRGTKAGPPWWLSCEGSQSLAREMNVGKGPMGYFGWLGMGAWLGCQGGASARCRTYLSGWMLVERG